MNGVASYALRELALRDGAIIFDRIQAQAQAATRRCRMQEARSEIEQSRRSGSA